MRIIRHPLSPLSALALVQSIVVSIYAMKGQFPSEEMATISSYGWLVLLLAFVSRDAHRRSGLPWFDYGLLLYCLAPVGIAYYAFWSRGPRGLWLLAIIGLLWLLPALVAIPIMITNGFPLE